MVEAQESRREPADLELVADIAGAEHAGRETDERGQHNEHVIEIVHQQIGSWLRTAEEQGDRSEEGQESRNHIERRRQPVARQRYEQRRRQCGNYENGGDGFERCRHPRSPRNRSSACKSTVSKRSRMRNRKIPITMNAMRMEKAMLISTTSGMPLAPVAASTSPFSSDMKPITWLTALRRVTISSRPSRMTASANARSSRASGSASGVTRSMIMMESATRATPPSMVMPTPTTVSISRWMPSRTMILCSATGITIALKAKAMSAVR